MIFAPMIVATLAVAGISAGASSATAAPVSKSPVTHLTVTRVPGAQVGLQHMFAYGDSHFASAAGKLPGGLVTALRRDLGESAEAYLAKADASSRAVAVMAGLRASGVDILGSHMTGTALTVNVSTAAAAAKVRAVGAHAVIGAPKPYKQTTPMKVDSNVVYPGEPFFSLWNSSPGVGAQCTIGFTGYKVTSSSTPTTLEPITAGHCVYLGSKLASHSYTVPAEPAGAFSQYQIENGTQFATTAKAEFGSGYDSSLLAAGSGVSEAPDAATWDYQYTASGTGTSDPNSSNPVVITGQKQAIVGDDLCKSGSRTGYSCGVVKDVNEMVSVADDSGKLHSVSAIIATTCLQPGDSGGAAFTGSEAVGIDSFGSSNVGCGDSSFRAGFFPLVASSSHPSVEKQYGSSWELQVSLAAPAITNPSSQGETLHSGDSMTGTVANASSGDYVAIYLDGATSTSRTATVGSDGTWTYPVSSLPGGSHTFVAQTRFGKYSASTSVSGSMTVIPKITITKPTISGTTQVGATLTAKSTATPASATLSYQWMSDGTDVGSNQATYVPVASDHDNTITVTVTGSASGYDPSNPSTSGATKTVVHGTLTTHKPVIWGSRNVGQTLTATTEAWGPAGVALTYQWLRNGKKIAANATGSTYTQVAADHDTDIDVTVTGTLDGYVTASATSTKTTTSTANPLFTKAATPTIDDLNPSVKDLLTTDPGSWAPGTPTFSYQWRENGHAISGATKQNYAISTSYVGKVITVTVTGKETGFATTSVTGAATSAVAAIPFSSQGTVTIDSSAAEVKGNVWKVATAGWSPTPTFSYQWLRDGNPISSATKSSYTITSSDAGTETSVRVTATKTGYVSVVDVANAP
jgi:hypothetical protein